MNLWPAIGVLFVGACVLLGLLAGVTHWLTIRALYRKYYVVVMFRVSGTVQYSKHTSKRKATAVYNAGMDDPGVYLVRLWDEWPVPDDCTEKSCSSNPHCLYERYQLHRKSGSSTRIAE